MSFKFERILNYPLAGCTGSDTDDTLLMIRCIEQNMNKIANDKNIENAMTINTIYYIYREYSTTVLNVNEMYLDYIYEAVRLAWLWSD